MNKKQFLKKYQYKAVHCTNKELAKEFVKLCDKYGIDCGDSKTIRESNYWNKYKENTCFFISTDNKFCYSDIDWLKQIKWEIIEFQSLKEKKKTNKKDIKINKDYNAIIHFASGEQLTLLKINKIEGLENSTRLDADFLSIIFDSNNNKIHCWRYADVSYGINNKNIEYVEIIEDLEEK